MNNKKNILKIKELLLNLFNNNYFKKKTNKSLFFKIKEGKNDKKILFVFFLSLTLLFFINKIYFDNYFYIFFILVIFIFFLLIIIQLIIYKTKNINEILMKIYTKINDINLTNDEYDFIYWYVKKYEFFLNLEGKKNYLLLLNKKKLFINNEIIKDFENNIDLFMSNEDKNNELDKRILKNNFNILDSFLLELYKQLTILEKIINNGINNKNNSSIKSKKEMIILDYKNIIKENMDNPLLKEEIKKLISNFNI